MSAADPSLPDAPARPAGPDDPGRRRWRETVPVVVIVTVFVVSRVVAHHAGLHFDGRLLHGAYQLLDVRLLHDDPVTSIYYLHSQPPLFNALTALVLQFPQSWVTTALAIVWHAAALATALVLYATAVRLGVRVPLATVLVCLFVVAPEVLLVEYWFFYTQLQLLLTALVLYGLARFADSGRTVDGLVFTSSLGALVLLRASLHVVLMVVLVTIVWRQLRVSPRRLAAIAAVPLVLVGAWSAKNLLVFDSLSNSTWAGMNLSYLARAGTTPARCRALVADQTVSASACDDAFRGPEAYTKDFPHPRSFGVAATDRLRKSTGQPNFNAGLYLDVASRSLHDSLALLRDGGPTAVARAELAAYTVWAMPGDDALQLRDSREPIAGYADLFDRWVLARPVATGYTEKDRLTASAGAFPWGDALGSVSYTLLALFGLAIYGGIAGWRRRAPADRALRSVCTVGLVLLLYSVVVGNALDYRENNRFRVEVAPVTLLLAAVGIELLLLRRLARHPTEVRVSHGTPTTVPRRGPWHRAPRGATCARARGWAR